MRHHLFGLIAALAVGGADPVSAQSAAANPATVVRDGDAALTCGQMADQAAELSAAMGESGGGGLLGRLGGMARAGATMVMPGAGLALAGADAVTTSGSERREAKADAARDRWNYLNGLYAGKGCGGAEDAVAATVQPSSTPALSPATATPTSTAPTATTPPRIQPAALPS
ncbi:hypothetical protein BH10PSE1_BH10PSE1_01540 [soil metagenome]